MNEDLNVSIPNFDEYITGHEGQLHLYVSVDGNDNNKGTEDSPFKTLAKAFKTAYSYHLIPNSFSNGANINRHLYIHLLNGNFGNVYFGNLPIIPGNIQIQCHNNASFDTVQVSNLTRIGFNNCIFNNNVSVVSNSVVVFQNCTFNGAVQSLDNSYVSFSSTNTFTGNIINNAKIYARCAYVLINGTVNFDNITGTSSDSLILSDFRSHIRITDSTLNLSSVNTARLFCATHSSCSHYVRTTINCSNVTNTHATVYLNNGDIIFDTSNNTWTGSITGKKYDCKNYSCLTGASSILGTVNGTSTNSIVN